MPRLQGGKPSPAGAPDCRPDAAVQGRLRGLAAWVHGLQPGWCRAAGGRCARLQVAEHVLQLAEQAARRLVARELRGGQALGRVRVRVGVRDRVRVREPGSRCNTNLTP